MNSLSTLRKSIILWATLVLSGGTIVAAPTITVWFGTNQSFGQQGNPQTAINILGNVSDPNGIQSLSYTLNGGSSRSLSLGPDTRRLLGAGDFNIDIPTANLNNGSNSVVITASNNLSQTSMQTVSVQYTTGNVWPTNYTIDWSSAGSISNVAQIVDGHWTLSNGKIRPTSLGYDRLVAVGDKTWTDYEVTVPITIYGIDQSGFGYPSNGPGVGLLFRWTGHTDDPISGWQPKTGFYPYGAIGWYRWDCCDPQAQPSLSMMGNYLSGLGSAGITLTFGTAYYFKMRVETVPGQGSSYKMKVWQVGNSEPSGWNIDALQSLANDPPTGSPLLLSHHVDAEFGNVVITPITSVPVQLSSFAARVLDNRVTLDWTTASETNNYGFEVQKSSGTTQNFVTVVNSFVPGHGTTVEPHSYRWIDPSTTAGNWHYRLKQIDLDGSLNFSDPVQVHVLTTDVLESHTPVEIALHQNYPNPFNPSTTVSYFLPSATRARVELFNSIGQSAATLFDGMQSAGAHVHRFDASSHPSGVYSIRLTAGGITLTRRAVLIK